MKRTSSCPKALALALTGAATLLPLLAALPLTARAQTPAAAAPESAAPATPKAAGAPASNSPATTTPAPISPASSAATPGVGTANAAAPTVVTPPSTATTIPPPSPPPTTPSPVSSPSLVAMTPDASQQRRPFRLGVLRLNPQYDYEKPLAMLDPAGFVANSGILIGAFDPNWVGGLSLTTQKVLWFLEAKSGLTAPPGSFGSSVVLGLRDGRLLKVDALSGKKLWTANLDSFTERPFLLNGTTLYVLTAAQVLYAIDYQTGKTLWLFDGGFPDGLTIRAGARPIVFDNKVIFGIASGEVLAVTADAGKLVWRYNPAYNDSRFHDVVGEMVVRNNKLLIARYDGLVAAIDLAAAVRSVSWQEQLPGLTTSVFRNGRYFVGGLNGDVYALDPDSGRRIWRTVTGAPVTTLTPGETTLMVAGARGRISTLELSGGGMLWDDELGSSVASPPVLFENAIYFTTGLKNIYGYKLR